MNFHKYEEDLITRVENDDGKRYIRKITFTNKVLDKYN